MAQRLTPRELEELRQLMTGIERGNWNAASKRRAFDLLQREVSARLEADMPRILERAKRQHNAQRASRQAAIDAGRRAGLEAGRQVAQQFMSEAHRRAHNAVVNRRRW